MSGLFLRTDLDRDVSSVQDHCPVLGSGPFPSAGAGGVIHGVWNLQNANDRQLVEGRSVAVQDNPLACGRKRVELSQD